MTLRFLSYIALIAVFSNNPCLGGTIMKFFQKGDKEAKVENEAEDTDSDDGEEEEESSDSSEKESSQDDAKKEASADDTAASEASHPATAAPTSTPSAVATPSASQAAPAPAKPKKEIKGDPVVARVGAHKVFRRSEVLNLENSLPQQLLDGMDRDKVFVMCLDQLVCVYLMVEQAKKLGINKTKKYLLQIKKLESDLLARMYLEQEIKVDDAVLKARYLKYVADYEAVKETELWHIVVGSEKEANEVSDRLKKGEKFEEVAKQVSIAPSKENGGNEGFVPLSILPPNIKDPIQKLKEGECTKEPIKIGTQYHFFKIGKTRDSKPGEFKNVEGILKQTIAQEKLVKLMERLKKMHKVKIFNEDGSEIKEPVSSAETTSTPAKASNPSTPARSGIRSRSKAQ